MTNRNMVKGDGSGDPVPDTPPLPPMPAPEDSPAPTTREEPVDSPHLGTSAKRRPPEDGEPGLTTER